MTGLLHAIQSSNALLPWLVLIVGGMIALVSAAHCRAKIDYPKRFIVREEP